MEKKIQTFEVLFSVRNFRSNFLFFSFCTGKHNNNTAQFYVPAIKTVKRLELLKQKLYKKNGGTLIHHIGAYFFSLSFCEY